MALLRVICKIPLQQYNHVSIVTPITVIELELSIACSDKIVQ